MAAPTIFPAGLQWAGLGKETTYGTPPAAPTVWVPLVGPKWKPNQTTLKDQAFRQSMAATHGQIAGVRYDTIDYATYPYLDSLFQHLMNIYGGPDAVTGAGDPWTHKTSLLNNAGNGQPASWSIWLSTGGAECWVMAGCQLMSLDYETKVSDSLAGLTASWMGLPAVVVTPPANTPTTKAPWPAWNSKLTIGGVVTTNYSDIKISFKRDGEAVFAANQTQSPYVIFVGELTVTGELTAVYLAYAGSPSDLANYLTNAQPILLLQTNPAGDAVHLGRFTHSDVAYDAVSVQDNGKYMEATSTLEMIGNTTDATNGGDSPGAFQLLSAVSAAY